MSNERWHCFGAEAFDLVLRKGKPGEASSAFLEFLWGGGDVPPLICRGLQHWSWSWKHQVRARGEAENLNLSRCCGNETEFEKPPIRVIFWFNRISTGHKIHKVYRVELMNDVKFHHFQWSLKELPPPQVAKALMQHFGIDANDAEKHLNVTIPLWRFDIKLHKRFIKVRDHWFAIGRPN